ncbi:transcriptional Coactivator p15-domain-containing protein [Paraphysoderma sedebokerense]|nr:transcriptional Coactivator p15-domain-containing protein [Paraphysoderma sedebokerense]
MKEQHGLTNFCEFFIRDLCIQLGDPKKRVTVRKWKGKTYVDIREFYEQDGDLKPGKKGISLTLEQYIKLKEVLPAVDDAINNI